MAPAKTPPPSLSRAGGKYTHGRRTDAAAPTIASAGSWNVAGGGMACDICQGLSKSNYDLDR